MHLGAGQEGYLHVGVGQEGQLHLGAGQEGYLHACAYLPDVICLCHVPIRAVVGT